MTVDKVIDEEVPPDTVVWLRDLDGTGSMHVCTPHDDGAVEYQLADRLSTQSRVVEVLRKAEGALARVVEGDGGMAVAKVWRADRVSSKSDQCEHGQYLFEGCHACAEVLLDPVLEEVRSLLSEEAGYVIAPKEPTEAMERAHLLEIDEPCHVQWGAMIQASKGE